MGDRELADMTQVFQGFSREEAQQAAEDYVKASIVNVQVLERLFATGMEIGGCEDCNHIGQELAWVREKLATMRWNPTVLPSQS
jgi:hypothetical protein